MGKRASHSKDGGALASRPVASVRKSVPLKLFMLNFNRSTKVLTMDGTLQIKPENLLNLGKYLCTVQFQLSLSSYGKKYPNHVMFRCQTVPNCDLLCKICSTRVFFINFQQKGLRWREEQVLQYLATSGLGGRKVRL